MDRKQPTVLAPTVLVIDRDGDRNGRAQALLRDAGFAVAARRQARAGLAVLTRRRFDLAVVAGKLPDAGDAVAVARRIREYQPEVKVLLLASADAPAAADDGDGIRVMAHPLDERRLRAAVFEIMAAQDAMITQRKAAELGIIAAQLACLFNRHAEAERGGATVLANDIAHQIGDAMAARLYVLQSCGTAPGAA